MCLHYSMGRHYVMTINYRLQLWGSLSDWRLSEFNTLLNRKNDFLLNIGDDFVIDFDSSKMSQNASNDVIQVGTIRKHAYKEGFNTINYIQFIFYCIESFLYTCLQIVPTWITSFDAFCDIFELSKSISKSLSICYILSICNI